MKDAGKDELVAAVMAFLALGLVAWAGGFEAMVFVALVTIYAKVCYVMALVRGE